MKHLSALNTYFYKYRYRLLLGTLFIFLNNYFRILSPQISGYIINKVQQQISHSNKVIPIRQYSFFVKAFIQYVEKNVSGLSTTVVLCGVTLLILAIVSGCFMFMMRQTIIVMSRHIEYDQKNQVFKKYQELDTLFLKKSNTGDLMNRISEDVSKVRMYTGPALMYFINLVFAIGMSVFFMIQQNWHLTLYVLAPLPFLALTIYFVNNIIHRKSEQIQALLSQLTVTAQESFSGIRVIKSFVQENATKHFFRTQSQQYKQQSVSLAKIEAIYFPAMALIIGLSTLLTVAVGCYFYTTHQYDVTAGTIAEFILYINFITFPVSAIGWTASMVQRAAASQKRLNEFLLLQPAIYDHPEQVVNHANINGDIVFDKLNFVYENTGIKAIDNLSLTIAKGEKILLLGKTGSGKTTLAQLLLHFYEPNSGSISINNYKLNTIALQQLRSAIGYVPQDVFLFSDTIEANISFGASNISSNSVQQAAKQASVHNDIMGFENGYKTIVGERGITLSGGQKQRISIARAILNQPDMVIFDDCLSAVDTKTEVEIVNNLQQFLQHKTAIIITHRIITQIAFDKVIVMDKGGIVQYGTVEQLLNEEGYFKDLYAKQKTYQ